MRAIAVAVVLLAHANVPGFSGGFVGVDVFFVISGFLITGLLITERQETGAIHYFRFLARRLRRLFPALLVMLVVVQVLSRVFLSTYEALMQTGSLIYAATWTSNFYFTFAEFNYFAVLQAKDFYLHTWSLGIEEQFYLLWPGLVVLSFAMAGANSNWKRTSRYILAVISIVFIGSLGLSLYWAKQSPLLSFYMMPSRGWQFALGASVFLYLHNTRIERHIGSAFFRSDSANQIIGALGLLMILGSTFFLHAELVYPGYFALIPSIGTALLLLAGAGAQPSLVNKSLAGTAFVWLGDRSYSVYLWHWPVLLLGSAYGLSDSLFGMTLLVCISVVIAMLSYQLIERPFWKGRFSKASPRAVALISALAVVSLVGTSHKLVADIFTGIRSPLYDYAGEARIDSSGLFLAGPECDSWHFDAEVKPCSVGDPDATHTVVLIGDSVGARWAPVLHEIYSASDWRLVVLTKSACAIVDVDYFYQPARGLYNVCTKWRAASIEYIADLKPDIVFVGSSAYYTFSESQWIEGTKSVIAKLSAASGNVVIFPGTPALSFDGPSCIREPYRFTKRLHDSEYMCEEKLASSASKDVAGYLEQAVRGISNAHILNLNNLVCPGQRCAARTREGVTVYSDNIHLTASFVLTMKPEIRNRLDVIGIEPSLLEETGKGKRG
tara:strand:- start:1985 stop:3982 length:1998 start_codon:yes stop_codon:yes gene_type:complete